MWRFSERLPVPMQDQAMCTCCRFLTLTRVICWCLLKGQVLVALGFIWKYDWQVCVQHSCGSRHWSCYSWLWSPSLHLSVCSLVNLFPSLEVDRATHSQWLALGKASCLFICSFSCFFFWVMGRLGGILAYGCPGYLGFPVTLPAQASQCKVEGEKSTKWHSLT